MSRVVQGERQVMGASEHPDSLQIPRLERARQWLPLASLGTGIYAATQPELGALQQPQASPW